MRSSLAVIRSLGKQGPEVTAGEETRCATGAFSRYCSHSLVCPSPVRAGREFVRDLLALFRAEKYDVIFPVADACLKPIIDHEEELSRYTRIALPPRGIFMKGYDKGATLCIARENTIPCLQTFFPESAAGVAEVAGKIDYPVVVKPRVSSGRRGVRAPLEKPIMFMARFSFMPVGALLDRVSLLTPDVPVTAAPAAPLWAAGRDDLAISPLAAPGLLQYSIDAVTHQCAGCT